MTARFPRCMAWAVLAACLAMMRPAAPAPGQTPGTPIQLAAKADADNALYAMTLEAFFPGEKRGVPKNLNLYLARREGRWVAAIGTPTVQGRPVWNTAIMLVDPAGLAVKDGRVAGTALVTLVPDPWVPLDQKARVATVAIDAAATPTGGADPVAALAGTWKSRVPGDAAELAAATLEAAREGKLVGGLKPSQDLNLADVDVQMAIYNLVPGQTGENYHRRRALSLGVKAGKVVSARLGQMDIRHNAYDYVVIDTPEGMEVTQDGIKGTVSFSTDTLDGGQATFTLALAGVRVAAWMAGTWKGKVVHADGKEEPREGFFRANLRTGAYESAEAKDARPWFAAVKDFRAPAPGEHPRLFFRKADLAELKRRAETPDGKKIVARLRQLLNGSDGESMPSSYNPAKQAYEKNTFRAAPGAYSISHAAGFGFLYQLSGDRKYADLARQCVEKAWAGQRNFDDRYAWVAPGGELRAGPSIGWYAVAYDLCYDAWDDAFRRKVALAIQNYDGRGGGEWNKDEGITLAKMVLTPRQGPGSNHFGAVVGGCGLAVLAIQGDPGADKDLLGKYAGVLERQVVRHLSAGWGNGGYYKEGWGASTVGTQGGFLCFLQALKTAAGRDYLNVERLNASYVTLVPRCLMLIGPPAVLPYRSNMGGTYGSAEFHRERDGFSHGGHFSEGFGAIADRFKPALLWTYNHIVEPDAARRDFDTCSLYPHRPMLALINWPTFQGIEEKNPAEVMPRTSADHLYDYFVFRNGWNGPDDIVTTVLINYPDGTKPRDVLVWGLGTRNPFGEPKRGAKVTHYAAGADGSGTLTAGDFALAVDYSRASGADALLISVGGGTPKTDAKAGDKVKVQTVAAGRTTYSVMTLAARAGGHPEVRAEGDGLAVGKQTVKFENGRFILGVFAPAK
ncbi:MAG: hypothetical protein FJ288_05690 [Planctomycetes bacterium]|nr:hypothetical protein [Planctomycetota bacterium]